MSTSPNKLQQTKIYQFYELTKYHKSNVKNVNVNVVKSMDKKKTKRRKRRSANRSNDRMNMIEDQ